MKFKIQIIEFDFNELYFEARVYYDTRDLKPWKVELTSSLKLGGDFIHFGTTTHTDTVHDVLKWVLHWSPRTQIEFMYPDDLLDFGVSVLGHEDDAPQIN